MANDQTQQPGGQPANPAPPPPPDNAQAQQGATPQDDSDDFDGLEGKKPDELTPEELRLMADTMPGEGPGD